MRISGFTTQHFLQVDHDFRMVSEFSMNAEKLKMLQAQVRTGGKGTVRRKKKVVHRTATSHQLGPGREGGTTSSACICRSW